MASEGIVYVAINEEYIEEAVKSIKRTKEVMPELPITLYANKDPKINQTDNVIEVGGNTRQDHRITRIRSLRSSPYDYTLYLDSDTYVYADVSSIFELLEKFDLLGVMVPFANKENIQRNIAGFRSEAPELYQWINAGVLAYRCNSKTRSMLDKWERLYSEYSSSQYSSDQIFLREALYQSDCSLGILPDSYNCMPKYLGTIYQSPKIVHGAALDCSWQELEQLAKEMAHSYTESDSYGIAYSGTRKVDKGNIYIQNNTPLISHSKNSYPLPRKYMKFLLSIAETIEHDGFFAGMKYSLNRIKRYYL